jgi:hypothetical protein
MKENSEIEDMISRDLDVRAGDRTYNRMRDTVLEAHKQSKQKPSATRLTIVRRFIMRKPIIRFAVAGVIIAMVVLGLFEFIGTDSKSGVVWADVTKRVEASRGVIYRNRAIRSGRSDMPDYSMYYLSAANSRHDSYKGDEITRTLCFDFDKRTVMWLAHDSKKFTADKMSEQTVLEQHNAWSSPKRWVQEFLSKDYRKLGQKTIDGVLCEGLETTDPTFGVGTFQVDSLMAQLWVSVATGYPVLLEAEVVGDSGQLRITGILDRFKWDVELDAGIFEPNIPPDYEPRK